MSSGAAPNTQSLEPLVPIFMGSKSDLTHVEKIKKALDKFGVACEMRICSAHKAPRRLVELIDRYESNPRPKVYITVAGRSNALSGMADANISAPIIACPPIDASKWSGNDVFSSIRMPGGVAPMLVLEPADAALAAVKIFGNFIPALREKVVRLQLKNSTLLHVHDCELTSTSYLDKINSADTFDTTNLELSPKNGKTEVEIYRGKVRDRYNDGKYVTLITTDRLTGFDRPLAKVPYKGQTLNLVSKWWFDKTEHILKNHILSVPHANVTIGKSCKPFPIEFVVRGYMTGSSATSMWTFYQTGERNYCGIQLPDGLKKNQKLWANLITPTTKSDEHDELIDPETIVKDGWMTQEEWDFCSQKALELFAYASKVALSHGLILVDTKIEMGRDLETGEIIVIDELFTPDSSRYWIASTYDDCMAAGKSPENIDKEFVRLWFKERCDPYKDETLPEAPKDLVAELSRRYIMLYELITGEAFPFSETLNVEESAKAALDLLSA